MSDDLGREGDLLRFRDLAKRLDQLGEPAAGAAAATASSAAGAAPRATGALGDDDVAELDRIEQTLAILEHQQSAGGPGGIAAEVPDEHERAEHEVIAQVLARYAAQAVPEPPEADAKALREFHRTRLRPLAREALERKARKSDGNAVAELVERLADEIVGVGPIEPYLREPDVSEIMVNGPRAVFVERAGRVSRVKERFFDETHLLNTIRKIVSRVNRRINTTEPAVDARLPDGSRIHAIIPPLALDGPVLNIRKFQRRLMQIEDLVLAGSVTPELAYFLGACVKAGINIVVGGGASSGKTTMLNILASLVPARERIITIEETAELQAHFHHPHVVRLEARPPNLEGAGEVSIRALVREALRMRPDRLIVGEVRGPEALDMLQCMSTGHEGSMSTVHATSVADVIGRLEVMALLSGVELSPVHLRGQILSAVDLIVQQRRFPDGSRKVVAVSEPMRDARAAATGAEPRFRDLFRFEETGVARDGAAQGRLRCTGERPGFIEKFVRRGIAFPEDALARTPDA